MFDCLRLVFYVGVVALVIAMACLIFVGYANSASRNISLALGTLLGALVLLAIQAWFELQPSSSTIKFRTAFTIDFAKNPSSFEGYGEKLWADMSLFSLVLYLWHEQHDWQITRDNFGTYERQLYLSQPEKAAECAKVEITEIQSKLRQIGNVFADYKPTLTPSSFMCLPPRSSLLIKPNEISIRTPFCEIRFVVEQPWIMKR